jgi:site-specific recombinase XerD
VLLNPATGTATTRPTHHSRKLALGKRAGIGGAHPHRFRDTFAVDMLSRGASLYDVAKMLGDTIDTVEKHLPALHVSLTFFISQKTSLPTGNLA